MAAKNKARGNAAEYYIREEMQEAGFDVDRGWGSDGRAMGENEQVDLRVNRTPFPELIQVKRRKAVASYIMPSEDVTAQLLYIDRSSGVKRQVLAVVTLDRYMQLLRAEELLAKAGEQEPEIRDIRENVEGWFNEEEDIELNREGN